jgi:penicillin-binding protein 1A
MPPFDRVEVVNPSDGNFLHWLLKFYAFGGLCGLGMLFLSGLGVFAYFNARLPPLPEVEQYEHQGAESSVVRGHDGTVLAVLGKGEREILTAKQVPPRLIQAFLAIEDRRFYEHGGIDLRGTLRATLANLRARGVAQGGSTITQQVARSTWLKFDRDLFFSRSFLRKIPEAILARRIEARYSKQDILTLYLNTVFLGQTAYGVAAAARRYFNKTVDQLDLGEMATLAGIAVAPSRFARTANLDRTQSRRDQVLAAMLAAGYISAEDEARWRGRPLVVTPPPDFFRERSPYFTEHVRRDIAKRYGEKMLWEGGLELETTVIPWIDLAAQENVEFSLRKLDKRQGWRGPVARLDPTAAKQFRIRAAERYGNQLQEGRLYLGLVESNEPSGARVRVGSEQYFLPSSNMNWAFPFSMRDSTNGKTVQNTTNVVRPGDVVWVSNAHQTDRRRFSDWEYDSKNEPRWLQAYQDREPPGRPQLRLEQIPRVQGAIFSYDHDSGYVVAMVGGSDFDRSEYNRISQSCRQPGSTYKPIYYSLALQRNYGYNSLLNDIPRAEVDPITGEVWVPTNLNNTIDYQVTLEYSLVWSKNVPSVQLFKLVGGREVENWARRLGMTTRIIPDQALALGASCVKADELTRAFSAFARGGVVVNPVYVRRVRDRNGQVLEDNTAASDPMGSPTVRLDRLVALAGQAAKPAIPPRTAWLTSQLLRRVVTRGHSGALRAIGLPAAGKTGTSSATMDTWFVGYTSRWMTTAWIGDDKLERPLGYKDAAFMLNVPMFARYIWEVAASQPLKEIPGPPPPGVRPGDKGGDLRTTIEAVRADDEAQRKKPRS